jgi:hypothetical protein
MEGRLLAIGVDKDVRVDGDHERPSIRSKSRSRSVTSTPGSMRPAIRVWAPGRGSGAADVAKPGDVVSRGEPKPEFLAAGLEPGGGGGKFC